MPYGAILEQQSRRRAVERRLEQKTSEVKVPNCGSQGALGGGRYAVCNLCPAENPNPVSVGLLNCHWTSRMSSQNWSRTPGPRLGGGVARSRGGAPLRAPNARWVRRSNRARRLHRAIRSLAVFRALQSVVRAQIGTGSCTFKWGGLGPSRCIPRSCRTVNNLFK